jgi:hypothetical protein
MIFEFREAMECPLVMALGGGYSKPIEFTIKSHVNTYKVARGFYL